MAKITIEGDVNGQAMASDLNRIIQDNLSTLLQFEATQMKIRITEGRDAEGNSYASPLNEYSTGYAKRKKESGRSISPVDMTYSGRMLASITTDVKPLGNNFEGTVFFSSNAEALKARGNIDNGRDFFGFTQEQRERLQQKLETAIKG